MGFLIIPALVLYVLFSLGIALWAVVYAIRRGKNPWIWGFCALFLMYNLVFWDWLPTVVAHKYYCSTEAGFWVYKTVDQWKAENPGVAETLTPYKGPQTQREGDMENYIDTYYLNERFNWIIKHNGKFFPNRWRHEQEIVDTKTNEILARYMDFSTSQERRQAGLSGWKFWLDSRNCSDGGVNHGKMLQFESQIEILSNGGRQ
jgi:hypothetical protein